jgi:hypothetical protein
MIEHSKNLQISLIDVIKLRLKQIIESESNVETTKIFIKEAKDVYNFINKYIEHIHFNRRGITRPSSNKLKEDIQIVCSYKFNIDIPHNIRQLLEKYLQSECMFYIYEELLSVNNIGKTDEVEKKGKFKRSGHLTDQILKYNYPKDKQPSLFDNLQTETLKDLEVAGVERAEIVEGIKLSPSETKIIDCLCKLLHETSQTLDAKKEDYYSGNIGYELVKYGGDNNTPAPKLAFTLYELTREYKGGEYVGGKDIENVKQILTELDNKKFLLSYVETTKKKDGGRIERKIEDFKKLIHIIKISETEYNKEDIELSKTEETIILLNPIFRRQINSKFILYPPDINRRTIIAYGSHNLSDIALRLRDELIRALSGKHYKYEIGLERLYYLLAEKWMKESRKTKVKQYTDKAIETVKALGLLISYEIKPGATGEQKVIFNLNKDWE